MNPIPSISPVNPVPASPSTRTGKIARLPAHIRQDLHQRLLDNLPSQNILAWLNTLPETRQILRDHFQSNPISPQNLSEWRQGGFRESLLRDELVSNASALHDTASTLATLSDPATLADNLATVLAARYATLLNTWDGEPSPAFEAKIKLLRHLTRDILALQKSLHRSEDLRRQRAREDAEQAAAAFEKSKAAALAKLRIPCRAQFNSHAYGPASRAVAETEAASTPEELHAISPLPIQPNQTCSNPPPAPSQPVPATPPHPLNPENPVNPVQINPSLPPNALKPVPIPQNPPSSQPIIQPNQTSLTE